MDNNYFDLAAALVEEAIAHLAGRGDTETLEQAFGADIEVFADHDYATLEVHNTNGDLLAAATAYTRPGGTRHAGIDGFRAGELTWWFVRHSGPDTQFWTRGTEHYTLTATAGSDTWIVSTFSADTHFATLDTALEFIARTEAQARDWAQGAA